MRPAVFLAALLALAGCAVTGQTLSGDLRGDEPVVFGRVELVDSTGRPLTVAPTAFIGHMHLVVVSEATGKEYSLRCDDAGLVSPFAVNLPPGRYRITKLVSGVLGQMTTPAHGQFTAEPRKLVYLGTLRFVGKGLMPYATGTWTVVDDSDATLSALRTRRPGVAQEVTVSLVTGVLATQAILVPFGTRPWRVGHQADRDDYRITEWVLPDETVQNWTELVTLQVFPGAQRTMGVDGLMEQARRPVMADCPTARWTVLRRGAGEILYEWETRGCPGVENQYEVAKLLSGFVALHRVAYTVRRKPAPDELRAEWTHLIGLATLGRVGAKP